MHLGLIRMKIRLKLKVFNLFFLIYFFIFNFSPLKSEDLNFLNSIPFSTSISDSNDILECSNLFSTKVFSFFTPRSSTYKLEDLTSYDLSSDEAKIKSLLHISTYIPTIFNHDIEQIMEFLNTQLLIQKYLKQISDYKKSFLDRPGYLEIRIQSNPSSNHTVYDTNPISTSKWSHKLYEILNRVALTNSTRLTLRQLIDKYLETFISQKTTSSAIISAILSFLSQDQKKEFLSPESTLDDKILWIKQNLNDTFPDSFKTQKFNFNPDLSTKENVIQFLTVELYLTSLLTLYCALENNLSIQHHPFNSAFLRYIGVNNFSFLTLLALSNRPFYLDSKISSIITESELPQTKTKTFSKISSLLSKSIISGIKPYMKKNTFQQQKNVNLILVEVPPNIGVLRGFVGGDCSTSVSFPYPNDPYERIFFIYSQDSDILGYLSTTEVDTPRGKMLYLNTISGARISTLMAESIIESLEILKEKLQVSFIGFPPDTKLSSLINYDQIKQAYNHKSKQHDTEEISYQKPHIRSHLERFEQHNSGFYDHRSSNQSAYIYTVESDSWLKIRTSISTVTHTKRPSLQKRGLYLLYKVILKKNLLSSNFLSMSLDFFNSYTQSELIDIIYNKDRLSISDYQEKIFKIFGFIPALSEMPQEAIIRSSSTLPLSFMQESSLFFTDDFLYKDSTDYLIGKLKDYIESHKNNLSINQGIKVLTPFFIGKTSIYYTLFKVKNEIMLDSNTQAPTYDLYEAKDHFYPKLLVSDLSCIPSIHGYKDKSQNKNKNQNQNPIQDLFSPTSSSSWYILLTKGGKQALMSPSGVISLDFRYNTITYVDGIFLIVSLNGKYGVIDYTGAPIQPLIYDSLEVDHHSSIVTKDEDHNPQEVQTYFYFY